MLHLTFFSQIMTNFVDLKELSFLFPFGYQVSVCYVELLEPCKNIEVLGTGELLKPVKLESAYHSGISTH